ncbi:Bromodomain-containing protein, partial [Hyaloraphidium curvatum]
ASIFEVIPTDNIAPGYSALVQEPIALSDIERNIKTGGYESFYEFLGDLHLMVSNAKFYNKQGSYPYKFATAIEV